MNVRESDGCTVELLEAAASSVRVISEILGSSGNGASIRAYCDAVAAVVARQGGSFVVGGGDAEFFGGGVCGFVESGSVAASGELRELVCSASADCQSSDNIRSGAVGTIDGNSGAVGVARGQGFGQSSVPDDVNVPVGEQSAVVTACVTPEVGVSDASGIRAVRGVGTPGVGVRGKNYEKNREKKRRRKELRARSGETVVSQGEQINRVWRSARVEREKKKKGQEVLVTRGHFSDLPLDEQKSLKNSYAARLQAENELKVFRAKQQLELEKAKDLTQLKKRQETQIMRQTELNKVQVEKAFAQLSRTGNVPGVVGSAETVVTSGSSDKSPVFSGVGSGSISPNSSISLAEIHALQKSELAKTHEIEKLNARLEKLKVVNPELYKDLGFNRELPPTIGTGVTIDGNGNPIIPGFEDDSSECFGYDGYVGDDGRFHFGENPAIYDA